MENTNLPNDYPPFEERLNIISHASGIVLSIIALLSLLLNLNENSNSLYIVSFSIYGFSLILLYTASTLFHSSKSIKAREKLNLFDHSSIYILIAGTYTPFALITLKGTTGWILFGVIWLCAITGIILKFFFIGKYNRLSTIMYVLMGWIIIFAIKPLIKNLELEGILWILAGGISYTLGALFFRMKKVRFNHFIFHILVLLGSAAHFISIYCYVLR